MKLNESAVYALQMGVWTLAGMIESQDRVKELIVLLGTEVFSEELEPFVSDDFDRYFLFNISIEFKDVDLSNFLEEIDALVDLVFDQVSASEKINDKNVSYADRERANYLLTLSGVKEQAILKMLSGEDYSTYVKSFENDFREYSINYKLIIKAQGNEELLAEAIENSQKDASIVLKKYEGLFKGVSLRSLAELERVG